MQTFLGAAEELAPEDVDTALIESSSVVYLEGYAWDQPLAKRAMRHAADIARAAGRRVALTLSDAFCVDRHRAEFLALIRERVDVLFANESEILALYETSDFDEALRRIRDDCAIAALTRSEKGSVIVAGDAAHRVAPERVDGVVDTTGAGDQYAAGFLHALTRGGPLETCGRVASICAGEVISHYGARPETDLAALVRQRMA
jgi:sugar/nucleoside kinase (ribokinase family)